MLYRNLLLVLLFIGIWSKYSRSMDAQNTTFPSFISENSIIQIDSVINLRGKHVVMPPKCTLLFIKDGFIQNGYIQGNATRVISGDKCIFSTSVSLSGSFCADKAFSKWFSIVPDCQLDSLGCYLSGINNIQGLANLFLFDNIVIAPGVYFAKGRLYCKSNQRIDGYGATIKWVNELNNTPFLILDRVNESEPLKNVRICGVSLIGSANEDNRDSEFCHGIRLGIVDGVSIKDVVVQNSKGDGIYIGSSVGDSNNGLKPRNIFIDNVVCKYNYRKNMSITSVDGLTVLSSEFAYGVGTPTSGGIDIEPNFEYNQNEVLFSSQCENIIIKDCSFIDNKGYGIALFYPCQGESVIRSILIENVNLYNCGVYLSGCRDIIFKEFLLINSHLRIDGPAKIQNMKIRKGIVKYEGDNQINGISVNLKDYYAIRSNISFNRLLISGFGRCALCIDGIKGNNEKKLKLFDKIRISRIDVNNCKRFIELGNSISGLSVSSLHDNGKRRSYLLVEE